MAKARSVGELVAVGFGWLLGSLPVARRGGAFGRRGPPKEIPGHDFLERAWGFEPERPDDA